MPASRRMLRSMGILWRQIDADRWAPTELASAARLTHEGLETLDGDAAALERIAPAEGGLLLRSQQAGSSDSGWFLLASPDAGVLINGVRLGSGIRRLADRDSIRVAGGSAAYFSIEQLAAVETFAAAESVYCPRCKLEIERGHAVVRCPSCGVFHHERAAEGQTCWTYAPTCALCDQPTDLDNSEFRWTPGGL